MKTILHISNYYPPHIGGTEVTARSIAEGMSDYRNIVVCFSSDRRYVEEVINGVEVFRVPVDFSLMRQSVSFSYLGILKKLFARYSPDICHFHCPNPFVYPLVKHLIPDTARLILHWHTDIMSKGLMYYIIKPFENAILKRADAVIATSPDYASGSGQLLKNRHKVHIAQSGVITSRFDLKPGDEDRIKEIKLENNGKPIVFFVGRHVRFKGVDRLISAEKYIKNDCAILIAGSGPMNSYFRSLPCSDRVKFLGNISDDDLRCYLFAADILAFPSVTKAEAFGLVLAEAMYCYTAPVTFTINGSGVNWVSPGGITGEQVPLGDVISYAASIDKLLSDWVLLEKYKNAAHKRVEDYMTEEKSLEAVRKVYAETVEFQ